HQVFIPAHHIQRRVALRVSLHHLEVGACSDTAIGLFVDPYVGDVMAKIYVSDGQGAFDKHSDPVLDHAVAIATHKGRGQAFVMVLARHDSIIARVISKKRRPFGVSTLVECVGIVEIETLDTLLQRDIRRHFYSLFTSAVDTKSSSL